MKQLATKLALSLLSVFAFSNVQGAVKAKSFKSRAASGLGVASVGCGLVWLGHTWWYYFGKNKMRDDFEKTMYEKESEAHDDLLNSKDKPWAAASYGNVVKAHASFKKRKTIFGWLTVGTAVAALYLGIMSLGDSDAPSNTQTT